MTATASGEKRYLEVPCRRKIGTKTMQIESVETIVGKPTSPAPWTMASSRSFPRLRWRSTFSITTVALSTRMPTARANPPSVITLKDSPMTYMTMTAVRTESGMEARMIRVSRPLPRKSRIIRPVRTAAIRPPICTLRSAALTNTAWLNMGLIVIPSGSSNRTSGRAARIPSITRSVDSPPVLRMIIRLPGAPSTATELVCTW